MSVIFLPDVKIFSYSFSQGRKEVYFLSLIPYFYPNFLSLILKVMTVLIPQNLLIPGDFLFIAPMRHYYTKIKIRHFTYPSLCYNDPKHLNRILPELTLSPVSQSRIRQFVDTCQHSWFCSNLTAIYKVNFTKFKTN